MPGRIFAVASADVSLKGVVPLLARGRRAARAPRPSSWCSSARRVPAARSARTMRELGLGGTVRFVRGIDDAEVAAPVRGGGGRGGAVALRGLLDPGAAGDVLRGAAGGHDRGSAARGGGAGRRDGAAGSARRRCRAGAARSARLLDDPACAPASARRRCGAAAERFSWEATARATADVYREVIRNPVP